MAGGPRPADRPGVDRCGGPGNRARPAGPGRDRMAHRPAGRRPMAGAGRRPRPAARRADRPPPRYRLRVRAAPRAVHPGHRGRTRTRASPVNRPAPRDQGTGRAERAAGAAAPLTPAQAVPLLVGLICLTGLEPECAKGLRSGCPSSPSSSGFVSLSYTKKRAHARTSKTMRVRAGGIATPAGLIRLVARLTEPARLAADSDALWVGAGGSGLRAWFDTGYELTSQLRVGEQARGWTSWTITAAARCGSTCGGSANRCGPAATCRPAGSSTTSRPATPRPSPPRTTPTSVRTMPWRCPAG
jgi:hypothetical protein